MITISNLSKSYGSKQVLKGLDLQLQSGKVYGIVGENGAGKTTFFNCLAGLISHEGEITSELNPLKDHLGFLQTDLYFLPKITGGEYLRLLCEARKVKTKDIEQQNIFELPLNQYAETYSTGMKKKLALTGVLMQQNIFFILDEPFNGVDIQSNMIISQLIHKLKAAGKILLISSHIFSTLQDTCDEIYLLSNGEFTKRVQRENFAELEQEMIAKTVSNRLDQLDLGANNPTDQ